MLCVHENLYIIRFLYHQRKKSQCSLIKLPTYFLTVAPTKLQTWIFFGKVPKKRKIVAFTMIFLDFNSRHVYNMLRNVFLHCLLSIWQASRFTFNESWLYYTIKLFCHSIPPGNILKRSDAEELRWTPTDVSV